MKKKFPKSDYPLLIRTDFSDDDKWNIIIKEITSPEVEYEAAIEFVNDRQFEGLTIDELPRFEIEQEEHDFVFLADTISMSDKENTVLCIDLADDFGANFRVVPFHIAVIANNLFITNCDFSDFQNSLDKNGIYRGQ